MKEQLTSFETAKLARKKGFFNGPKEHGLVFGPWYNERGEYCGRTDVDDKGVEINFSTYGKEYQKFKLKSYYAPTQSLLQKWLREEHKFYVHPVLGLYENWGWIIEELTNRNTINPPIKDCEGRYYKTYESALEKGLQKALKLTPNKH